MNQNTRKIYLIRHGETVYNKESIFRGRADIPLNENGRKQALTTALKLKGLGIEAIFSSPLKRAIETADIISSEIGAPVTQCVSFQNIDVGEWQAKAKADVQKQYPDLWRKWLSTPEDLLIPGGEMISDVRERSVAGLKDLIGNDQTPGVFAIVSHRSVFKCLIAGLLGMNAPYFWKLRLDNCSISTVEHSPEAGFVLTSLNNTFGITDIIIGDD